MESERGGAPAFRKDDAGPGSFLGEISPSPMLFRICLKFRGDRVVVTSLRPGSSP